MKKNFLPKKKLSICEKYIKGFFLFIGLHFLFISPLIAQNLLDQVITLNVSDASLEQVFNEIENSTRVTINYTDEVINIEERFSFIYDQKPVYLILNDISSIAGFEYRIEGSNVSIKKLKLQTISGVATDVATGESLIGVTIQLKGTSAGTISDGEGRYTIDGYPNSVIQFSYIGYETKEAIAGNRTILDISLTSSSTALDEVVVIGYGVQKRINLTGAVDQIDGEQVDRSLGSNTSQMLQGLIPNVNITFSNGGINEKGSINIRGGGSINGGEPLILIDGVEGDLNYINPKDIESISVLKDAASSSIYGARAAFGVILITTKGAKSGELKVNYNNNFGWSSPTIHTENFITDGLEWLRLSDKLSLLENTSTYLGYSEEDYAYLEARQSDPSLPSVLIKTIDGTEKYVHYANTDWWDYIFNDKQPSQEHNLNLTGGTDKVSFYLSGRYYNRKGIYRVSPDVLDSYTLRSKISVKPTDWLNISNSTNIYQSKYSGPATNTRHITGTDNHEDWRKYSFHASPVFNPTNPDGSLIINGPYSLNRDIADGTFADLIYGKSKALDNEYDLTNTSSLKIDIAKGLALNTDYSFRKGNPTSWVRYIAPPHTNQPDGVGVNLYRENKQVYKEWAWERFYQAVNAYLSYNYNPSEKHNLSGVIGYNQEWRTWKRNSVSRNGNLSEDLNSFNLATGENITLESDANEWAIRAGFYRLNYIFSNKYLIEFNGRFDFSSKFPKDNRLGIFPSASAAWRISEEEFYKGAKNILNDLKLRASYGTLGNQDVGPYDYISTMSIIQGNYISNGSKMNYFTVPNPISSNFTWEKSATIDFGIDLAAFDNRITATFDWYQRSTTDMLTQGKKLPSVFGASEPEENAADLQTQGFELSVNWKENFIISNREAKLNMGFILADYTTIITRFDNPNGDIEQYYEGQVLGEVWGYTVEGFFQTDDEYLSHADQLRVNRRIHENYLINHPVAGDIKFKDTNEDGIISAGDRTLDDPGDLSIIGNTTPRYSFGFTLGAEYAGFDLQAFFQGVAKQNWWPGKDNSYFFGPFARQYENFYPKSIESMAWTPDNYDAYFPRLAVYSVQSQGLEGSQLGVPSDKYLQDVGYIRLKNVSLGYTLPNKWMRTLKMERIRLYATGSNLLTFSKLYKNNPDRTVDPEQLGDGNAYPFSKTYVIGIDVNF